MSSERFCGRGVKAMLTVAALLSMVQALLWAGLAISGIVLYESCVILPGNLSMEFRLMFIMYFLNPKCYPFDTSPLRPSHATEDLHFSFVPPTTARTTRWAYTYTIVSLLWVFVSAVMLASRRVRGRNSVRMCYPWVVVTAGTLVTDLVAAFAYGPDSTEFTNVGALNRGIRVSIPDSWFVGLDIPITLMTPSLVVLALALRFVLLWLMNAYLLYGVVRALRAMDKRVIAKILSENQTQVTNSENPPRGAPGCQCHDPMPEDDGGKRYAGDTSRTASTITTDTRQNASTITADTRQNAPGLLRELRRPPGQIDSARPAALKDQLPTRAKHRQSVRNELQDRVIEEMVIKSQMADRVARPLARSPSPLQPREDRVEVASPSSTRADHLKHGLEHGLRRDQRFRWSERSTDFARNRIDFETVIPEEDLPPPDYPISRWDQHPPTSPRYLPEVPPKPSKPLSRSNSDILSSSEWRLGRWGGGLYSQAVKPPPSPGLSSLQGTRPWNYMLGTQLDGEISPKSNWQQRQRVFHNIHLPSAPSKAELESNWRRPTKQAWDQMAERDRSLMF